MTCRLAVAATAGLLVFLTAGARAEQGARPPVTPAQTPVVRSLHVQGNVWMINAGSVNVAAQIGDQGVLLVDTGTEAAAAAILTLPPV